jgi:hypothetical protein
MSEADPLAPADPLQALSPPERVNYETGVLLDAEDFRDEQTYHRARLARALKYLIGFGTLAGLRVTPPAAADAELELTVEPGIAVDRLGRLIELQASQCIRLARWFAAQSTADLRAAIQHSPRVTVPAAVVVDVFLSAATCPRGKTPSFQTGPFDALDAVVPARLAENAKLELIRRTEGPPNPIPTPQNFWPPANAARDTLLQAVLGSWEPAPTSVDGSLDPLQEHVQGHDSSALFLARVAIPVTEAVAPATRPTLNTTLRVSVDNSARPFVALPGKWLGRAFTAAPLVQP